MLNVPINQTGTYTLLTHSTLFAGNSTTEPITLKAKFTNFSSDVIDDSKNTLPSKSIVVDSKNSTTISESDNPTMIISDDEQLSKSNDYSNFEIGLIMGIIVGVAIGISMFFIIRQKTT